MSCKLFAAEGSQAAGPMPMQWGTIQSPASFIPAQSPFTRPPSQPGNDELDELKKKLAAMEQKVREAHAAGVAEGEAQAKRSMQSGIDHKLQELASAIHEASEIRGRLRTQAEADLVRLAIAIARRIVARELNADPEAITGLVKAALERMKCQEILRVRVHPAHSGYISDCMVRYGAPQAQIVADPAAEPGTVIFETGRGNFNASAETQLGEIERGLTDRFRGQGL